MKESNIKLIHLQNQGIDINPFTSKFNYFVLYEYLFKGTSMKSIEDDYFHNESGRGFDASRVLAYFKIPNTEENKNIYNGLNVSDVSKFLLSIPNIDYQKIGEALSKKEIKSTNNSVINSFQKYYEENLSNLKVNEKDYIEKREKFKKEYPLESIKELSLNEYVLGSNSNKESLCYKLEYGEYKNAGPGIGGATAAKFGIYKHKDNEFYGKGNKKIENPEHYWQNLRYQLYMFLKEFKTCEDTPIKASEKYPMLSGMGMVLTKLLYIYYPDKVVNICSRNKLLILMRYFGYECGNDMQPEGLSFLLNKNMNVTILHSKTLTNDMKFYLEHANLIIVAVGKPYFLKKDDFNLKDYCFVFDVGINRIFNKELNKDVLIGDCEKDLGVFFQSPVPKGVGLLTRLALLLNLEEAYKAFVRNKLKNK